MTLSFLTPLSKEEQRINGLPETWPLAMADRVRFGEVDCLNHVNNAAYMGWFETIRTCYFQQIELLQNQPDDPRIVIRRAEIDYEAEMRMNEEYIVTARCREMRNTSFTLDCEIWSNAKRRAKFVCVIVLLFPDGSARLPLPDRVRQYMRDIDGAIQV